MPEIIGAHCTTRCVSILSLFSLIMISYTFSPTLLSFAFPVNYILLICIYYTKKENVSTLLLKRFLVKLLSQFLPAQKCADQNKNTADHPCDRFAKAHCKIPICRHDPDSKNYLSYQFQTAAHKRHHQMIHSLQHISQNNNHCHRRNQRKTDPEI